MSPRAVILDAALAIAAAALIAWGVFALGWSVFAVMALFWLENVLIGVLNITRMIVTGVRGGPALLVGAFATAAFFAVHYGMFTAIHGVFVVALFGGELGRGAMDGGLLMPAVRMVGHLLSDREGWLAFAALAAFQLTGFMQWMATTHTSPQSLPQLMQAPYGRVVILHLTLIAGGFLVQLLGAPVAGALLLIGLKLAYDLRSLRNAWRSEGDDEARDKARRLLVIGRRRLDGRS